MDPILNKIKLLLNLVASPNENEAANAKLLAQKLIEKHSITDEQLNEIANDGKPAYDDSNVLFESPTIIEWKSGLALIVSKKYDCFVIQEENVASTGEVVFKYIITGESDDIAISKQLFNFIVGEAEKVIKVNCQGRGSLYEDSYCEGLLNGVRINIEYETFVVSGLVKVQENLEIKPAAIEAISNAPKPPKVDKRVEVNKKDKALDIWAYFRGEGDGRGIHIGELNNDKLPPADVIDISKLFNF